tara:strand:+ start:62 stop:361 length:300 start_codon:yes stop_codon:yes gene_type:complete
MKTYYDEINGGLRHMVVWLDQLIANPDEIYKMHRHHIHLLQIRGFMTIEQPFHKNPKINKWINDKLYKVVEMYNVDLTMKEEFFLNEGKYLPFTSTEEI